VQIVYSSHRGSRDIEHVGSAHDEVELGLLKAVARQRLAAGQGVLDLGLEVTGPARKGAGGGRDGRGVAAARSWCRTLVPLADHQAGDGLGRRQRVAAEGL
jgi:hypothetical protein